jgi:hypothetical protein
MLLFSLQSTFIMKQKSTKVKVQRILPRQVSRHQVAVVTERVGPMK